MPCRSTASESNFRIKIYKQLSLISCAVLHNSGMAAIQMLCFGRAKQYTILMYLARLHSCCATVEPNCNWLQHGRSTTSNMGLRNNIIIMLTSSNFIFWHWQGFSSNVTFMWTQKGHFHLQLIIYVPGSASK